MLNDKEKNEFISLLEKGVTQKELMDYFFISIIELDVMIRTLLKEGVNIQRLCCGNGNINYK